MTTNYQNEVEVQFLQGCLRSKDKSLEMFRAAFGTKYIKILNEQPARGDYETDEAHCIASLIHLAKVNLLNSLQHEVDNI